MNKIRKEYLTRAHGLGLMVIFNTTVHKDNFVEIPQLVKFFTGNADVVGFASFQLQAETGRGEWGSRATIINQQTVRAQVETEAGKSLPWDVVKLGHGDCHSYMPTLVINDIIYPIIDDVELFGRFLISHQSMINVTTTLTVQVSISILNTD